MQQSPPLRPVVLYHANCNDGFTAAWIAQQEFGDQAKYVPCHYGQPVYELEAEDGDVYMLDFSYKAPDMDRLYRQVVERQCQLNVLDHHESAIQELSMWLAWLTTEGSQEEKFLAGSAAFKEARGKKHLLHDDAPRNLYVKFDLDECGASLAWKFWRAEVAPPALVKYVKDRDLWTKKLPDIEEVSAYIETLEKDFVVWAKLRQDLAWEKRAIVNKGYGALALKSAVVRKAAEHAVPITLKGEPGYAVNGSAFFSEIAGELAALEGSKFGAVYFQRTDLRWQFSLRSRSDFRVNDLAVQFGGGGHPRAAGFEIDDLREVGLHV